MSFDTAGGAQALLTIVQGLSVSGQIGVPETPGARLYCTVSAASQAYSRITLGANKGKTSRDTRYLLSLVYRLDGGEATAELALMAKLDAIAVALAIGTETAGGQVVAFDTGLADTPEYQLRAGKEYREFPILVTLRQYHDPAA